MESGPSPSRRQSLEERIVVLFSQDVDRLSQATQACVPAGDLAQARENLDALKSRLREAEELLHEIDQLGAQPRHQSWEHTQSSESRKRDDRSVRGRCSSCGQEYPLRLYRVGWRYRWLCGRCSQKQFPKAVPLSPRETEN